MTWALNTSTDLIGEMYRTMGASTDLKGENLLTLGEMTDILDTITDIYWKCLEI